MTPDRVPNPVPSTVPVPALVLDHGKPEALSTDVAMFFGKRHDNVLRDIDNLCAQLPADLRALNFGATSTEVDQPNGGTRTDRAYLLTRDGFTLLAMGFTGKKALAFKVAYIAASRPPFGLERPPRPTPAPKAAKRPKTPWRPSYWPPCLSQGSASTAARWASWS